MTIKQYLASMFAGSVIAWFAWAMIVLNVDPYNSGYLNFFLFYATLFMSLVGTFAVAGFAFKVWITKENDIIFRNVKKTFRQGILFALVVCIALVMKSQRFFNLWTIALLILVASFIEFFFISYKNKRQIK